MKTRMIVLLLLAAGSVMAQRSDNGGDRKPPTPAELINKLDKDGDGKISKSEFDGPAEHFTAFDKNQDGYISKDEVPSGPPPRGNR